MRLVLLSSFDGPVCIGEGHPRLLLVGPLAVVPPPLGPFVTGASMLLMIWGRAREEAERWKKRRRGTTERKGRETSRPRISWQSVFKSAVWNAEHLAKHRKIPTNWVLEPNRSIVLIFTYSITDMVHVSRYKIIVVHTWFTGYIDCLKFFYSELIFVILVLLYLVTIQYSTSRKVKLPLS